MVIDQEVSLVCSLASLGPAATPDMRQPGSWRAWRLQPDSYLLKTRGCRPAAEGGQVDLRSTAQSVDLRRVYAGEY